MNTFFSKIFSYAKAHKIITAVVVIAVLIEGSAIALGVGKPVIPTYVLSTVRIGTISQTVSGTGQVQGENQINVTPQGSGGQVVAVNVTPGQMVTQGQVLVTLDDQTALSSLQQAKASLESAQANYDTVVSGLTPEQVAADQAAVTNATQSLIAELISSYTQINNTIRTDIDSMFTNPTTDPSFGLGFLDSNGNFVTFSSNNPVDPVLVAKINGERIQVNNLLPAWQTDISSLSLSASSTDLEPHVTLALNDLQYIAGFFNDLSTAVYGISAQYTKYSSNISAYKSTVASALQTVDSQISGVVSSNQSLITAETNYNVNTTPPTNANITNAQASLDNAQASLQTAQTAYDDTRVTAPFTGQVGAVSVQLGDIANAGTAVAILTTTQKIADISLNEVDAATVHIGDPAILTFSALPNASVPAYVSQMSLVGTVSSGVVDYDVKLSLATSTSGFASMFNAHSGIAASGTFTRTASSTFSTTTVAQNFEKNLQQTLSEIKPGMSVTATIITKSDSNAVLVPSSAVKTTAGGRGSYVQELPNATVAGTVSSMLAPTNVTVTTGIVSGTQTEILSGLTSGDLIISQTLKSGTSAVSAAASATTRSPGGFGGGGGGRVLFGG